MAFCQQHCHITGPWHFRGIYTSYPYSSAKALLLESLLKFEEGIRIGQKEGNIILQVSGLRWFQTYVNRSSWQACIEPIAVSQYFYQ